MLEASVVLRVWRETEANTKKCEQLIFVFNKIDCLLHIFSIFPRECFGITTMILDYYLSCAFCAYNRAMLLTIPCLLHT